MRRDMSSGKCQENSGIGIRWLEMWRQSASNIYVKGSYNIQAIGDRHRRPQHDGAVAVNLLTPSVFDSPN